MDWTMFLPLLVVGLVVSAAVNGFLAWCRDHPAVSRPVYVAISVVVVAALLVALVPRLEDTSSSASTGFLVGGFFGPLVRELATRTARYRADRVVRRGGR